MSQSGDRKARIRPHVSTSGMAQHVPGELEVPITIGARRAGSSACRGTRHASAVLQVGKSWPRVAWAGPTRSFTFRSGVFTTGVVFQSGFPQCVVARLVVFATRADDKIPCYVFNIIPPERLVDAYSWIARRHSDATGRTPDIRASLTLTSQGLTWRPASASRACERPHGRVCALCGRSSPPRHDPCTCLISDDHHPRRSSPPGCPSPRGACRPINAPAALTSRGARGRATRPAL